jgi:hypothetical protein
VGVRVSVFVWGTRDAEGVGRGRERSASREPLTRAATATAHAGRHPSGRAPAFPIKPHTPSAMMAPFVRSYAHP